MHCAHIYLCIKLQIKIHISLRLVVILAYILVCIWETFWNVMHSYMHAQFAALIAFFKIKSNQITFIVTSPQHKCLGEWNFYERAPDRAKKQQQQFTYGQTVQKKQQQFTYGQYIFTDCTEDNVQNTHTYTQYTQCTIKTYSIISDTLYTVWAHLHYVQYLYIM